MSYTDTSLCRADSVFEDENTIVVERTVSMDAVEEHEQKQQQQQHHMKTSNDANVSPTHGVHAMETAAGRTNKSKEKRSVPPPIDTGVDGDFVLVSDASHPDAFYISGDETDTDLESEPLPNAAHDSSVDDTIPAWQLLRRKRFLHCLHAVSWMLMLCGRYTPLKQGELEQLWKSRRSQYKQKKRDALLPDEEQTSDQLQSLESAEDNPLSTDRNSVWKRMFNVVEMRRQIDLDLNRTPLLNGEHEPLVHICRRVLLVWSVENPEIAYVQGMNEVVAVVARAVMHDLEVLSKPESLPSGYPIVLKSLLEPDHQEDDIYTIFEAIMSHISSMYAGDSVITKNRAATSTSTTLHSKLFHIHHQLLKALDLPMYRWMERNGIHAPLYLLRWTRCLFSRELPLDQVFHVWDALIASDELNLIDYMCVSLCVWIARQAQSELSIDALQLFMRVEPPKNIAILIRLAERLQKTLSHVTPLQSPPPLTPHLDMF